MEYTVQQLAALSGVTARTLRYYDQIGLLCPARQQDNGYRLYGPAQVERLQQILLYREMAVPLEEIAALLDDPAFDSTEALREHLHRLETRRERLDALIQTVEKTIRQQKGETTMQDTERFAGFRAETLRKNEETYGDELRQKYGSETVEAANKKFAGMSQADWEKQEALRLQISEELAQALAQGDPAGEKARHVCELHKEWLEMFWPKGMYSPQAHAAMGDMYAADERFAAYYEAVAPGATTFFQKALHSFTGC